MKTRIASWVLLFTYSLALYSQGAPLSTCAAVASAPEAEYPQVEPVDADPQHGFNWPYLVFVPKTLITAAHPVKARLLVAPNNTGKASDDLLVHVIGALDEKRWRKMANDLGAVLLIPVFPRPESNKLIYTHALGRSAMLTKAAGLERLDLQLIQMMTNLRERERKAGIEIEPRAFMLGFSASGMFVNRFTFMHPDQVFAAAFGSPGGWPIAPVSRYASTLLRYPIGVGDFHEVTGANFDIAAVAKVPQFVFMGDEDVNDSVTFSDSYEDQDRATVFKLFGQTLMARWPIAMKLYGEGLPLATFKLYPGAAHHFTPEMRSDVETFFCEQEREQKKHQ